MSFLKRLFGKKEEPVEEASQEEVLTSFDEAIKQAIKESAVEVKALITCDCAARQVEHMQDIDGLQKQLKELEKERRDAERKLEKTKLDHKMTVEDIKHMQKLLDEKNQLDVDRQIFEGEKRAEEEIKRIRKEYADKLEKELAEERKKMQAFMGQVMEALPNVNVRMKGDML